MVESPGAEWWSTWVKKWQGQANKVAKYNEVQKVERMMLDWSDFDIQEVLIDVFMFICHIFQIMKKLRFEKLLYLLRSN